MSGPRFPWRACSSARRTTFTHRRWDELIKQEIEEIQGSIAKTLQIYLHNDHLKLSVRVAEQKEKVKILSRKEQYDQMAEKNPAVAKLQQAFDLELA